MKNKCFHHRRFKGIFTKILGTTIGVVLCPELALGTPNGAWLSQPQIRFHSSTNTLPQVMADIQGQNYKVVFLDFRNVPDAVQQQTAQTARQQGLKPIVWIQSPQYRLLTVPMLIHEARHGDGMQVDDHFFANYSLEDFRTLRFQYSQPIFCSIQPFQSALVPKTGCNQLDLQCYTSNSFSNCEKLADRLKAVLSLSDKDTYKHKERLGGRSFNVFLWPYSHKYFGVSSKESLLGKTLRPFSFCGKDPADAPLKWRKRFRHRVLVKREGFLPFRQLANAKIERVLPPTALRVCLKTSLNIW